MAADPGLLDEEIDHLYALHHAVLARRPEVVRLLIDLGAAPHIGLYPHRSCTSPLAVAKARGYEEVVAAIESSTGPPDKPDPPHANPEPTLWYFAGIADYDGAKSLLEAGADPNEAVFAGGSPMFRAYSQGDEKMIALLRQYGGLPEATTAGLFRLTDLARQMLAGEAAYRLDAVGGETIAEQLLWGAACGGDPEIVVLALDHVNWPRGDSRWFGILEQPLRIWQYGEVSLHWDRGTYPVCFALILQRTDPKIMGRFGLTLLHSVADSRDHVTIDERNTFANLLLKAGAEINIRDRLLDQTPLAWARRRQRTELEALLAAHGAV